MGKLPRIVIQMDGLDKVQALDAHLSAQLAEIDNTLDCTIDQLFCREQTENPA